MMYNTQDKKDISITMRMCDAEDKADRRGSHSLLH